jgi:hypothetical protein
MHRSYLRHVDRRNPGVHRANSHLVDSSPCARTAHNVEVAGAIYSVAPQHLCANLTGLEFRLEVTT